MRDERVRQLVDERVDGPGPQPAGAVQPLVAVHGLAWRIGRRERAQRPDEPHVVRLAQVPQAEPVLEIEQQVRHVVRGLGEEGERVARPVVLARPSPLEPQGAGDALPCRHLAGHETVLAGRTRAAPV